MKLIVAYRPFTATLHLWDADDENLTPDERGECDTAYYSDGGEPVADDREWDFSIRTRRGQFHSCCVLNVREAGKVWTTTARTHLSDTILGRIVETVTGWDSEHSKSPQATKEYFLCRYETTINE